MNARLYLLPGTARCLKCARSWSGGRAGNDAVWHTRQTSHPTVSLPEEESDAGLEKAGGG